MRSSSLHPLLAVLLVLMSALHVSPAHSQAVDLYRRVSDPRAIARLDGPDVGPLKGKFFHSFPYWDVDSSDMFGVIARDTGSGIITHLWATEAEGDSLVFLKLYINDSLFLSTTYRDFFKKVHGAFRPPLDSVGNGAVTWDVQIPYHHGFRMTVQTPGNNIYFGVEWRPVSDGKKLPWFTLTPLYSDQVRAESRLHLSESPWHDAAALIVDRTDTLTPGSVRTIATLDGPAMLQMLRFQTPSYDYATLDSTWLRIYWDDAVTPSVNVPLLDFFMSPNGVTKVRAFQLRASTDSGFVSYFPMPFYRRARIEIVRTASQPLELHTTIQYNREGIDRNLYGYFHADFSESNPTKYHVYHPVLHTLGRGRYIGYSFGVMGQPHPAVYLEGDPVFNIDSNPTYHLRYTGGEDYFNAGWWFADGLFTLPFAGFTHYIDAFYRFHYLDCYDFDRSFEFDLQPGADADIHDHFRTVGYSYQHWTPFWTNRDTIRSGENWRIAGAGYKPGENIVIAFGIYAINAAANTSGAFDVSLTVPSFWTPGVYTLSVNGEASPKKLYLLSGPSIRIARDTLPVTVVYRDSLTVSGAGFEPGETVHFYFDSISLDQSAVADSNFGFRTTIRVPYLAEHQYLLVARAARSGNATAEDRVNVTRTLILQCEDMMPPLGKSPGQCYAENVSYFWMGRWGKQEFVYFKPDTIIDGAWVELGFDVPHADTFRVEFHNSVGSDLGKYRVLLDDQKVAELNGYQVNSPAWWDPLPSGAIQCGSHYLAEGPHRLRFICLGKSDSARNAWIQPDFIVLQPLTDYPLSPGTLQSSDAPGSVVSTSLSVYPNPLHTSRDRSATMRILVSSDDTPSHHARAYVTVYDVLGKEQASIDAGSITGGSLSTELPRLPSGDYYLRVQLVSEGSTRMLPVYPFRVE